MRPWLSLAFAPLLLSLAHAQAPDEENGRPTIFVDSDTVAPYFAQAQRYEKEKDWRLLFERYKLILANYPDSVKEVEPGRYVGVREYIQRRLGAYPPEAIDLFREMLEPDARVLWNRYTDQHDLSCLERLVDSFFLTSRGQEAARVLAEVALERGDAQQALWLWTRLVSDGHGTPSQRAYSVLRVAVVARRYRLSDRLDWAEARAKGDLGAQVVSVGGRETTLSQAIALVRESQPPGLSQAAEEDWPSPGGSPSNDRVGSGEALNEQVAWTWPPAEGPATEEGAPPPNVAFSPAAARWPKPPYGEVLFHADGQCVVALDVSTGRVLWQSANAHIVKTADFAQHVARFLGSRVEVALGCTVEGDVVYTNHVSPPDAQGQTAGSSSISAYNAWNGKWLWDTPHDSIPQEGIITCPPLVRGDQVFAVVIKPAVTEPACYVCGWSARTGKPLWYKGKEPRCTLICGGQRGVADQEGQASPFPAAFLAEGGGRLFVLTNLGAVAALSESTGEVLWITDYLAKLKGSPRPRGARAGEVIDLPVLRGDTLYCAPKDTGFVLALDATTGAMRAGSPREVEGVHTMIGSTEKTLLVLAERKNKEVLVGIPFDLSTKGEGPKTIGIDPPLIGRSFVTDGWAYIASGKGLYRFNLRTFMLNFKFASGQSSMITDAQWKPKESAGHVMVLGETIVTIGRRITGLCSLQSYNRRFESRFATGLPEVWIDRGHANWTQEIYPAAAEDLEKALSLCVLRGTRIEVPPAADVRRDLAKLYLEWGRKAEKEQDLAVAGSAYVLAARRQTDPVKRVEPLFALAAVDAKQRKWIWFVNALSRALACAPRANAPPEEGLRVRVADVVAVRFLGLRKEVGDFPFVQFDADAERAAAALGKDATEAQWQALVERYPGAPCCKGAEEALLRLASGEEERRRALLAAALRGAGRPEGLAPLQWLEELERTQHPSLARWTVDAVESGYDGGEKMGDGTVADWVRARRKELGSAGVSETPLAFPLRQLAVVKAPAGSIDADTEPSSLPFVTPVPVEGELPDPIELRNMGGNLEARKQGAEEPLWSVTDNRGWLGVVMNNDKGAVTLSRLIDGEPAAKAGLQVGDSIEEVDGVRVEGVDHLIQLIAARPDREVLVKFTRASVPQELRVRIGCRALRRGEHVDQALATPGGTLLLRRSRRLQAVDPMNGKVLWAWPSPPPEGVREAFVNNLIDCWATWGRVYVLASNTVSNDTVVRVACLEERTGEAVWERDMAGRTLFLLHAGTDCLLVASQEGDILTLDARTGESRGEPVRVFRLVRAQLPAAVSDGKTLYCVTSKGTLQATDVGRAKVLWWTKLDGIDGNALFDLQVGEGVVAVARAHHGIELFDAVNGERKGEGKKFDDTQASSLTISHGPIATATYPAGDGFRLSVLDLCKGEPYLWDMHFSGAKELEVAHVQGERVFVREAAGPEAVQKGTPPQRIVSIDRASGKREWEQAVPDGKTSPRVAAQGGRLCVSVDDQMILFGK